MNGCDLSDCKLHMQRLLKASVTTMSLADVIVSSLAEDKSLLDAMLVIQSIRNDNPATTCKCTCGDRIGWEVVWFAGVVRL